jgi:diguanylate cyclase (GGDEF)-like protein
MLDPGPRAPYLALSTLPMSDPHASTDPGAGIFSLTQIRHLMRVEFSRAQRYGYPLACLVVSIDRLDHLRDLYGYEFQSSVAEAVVELVQNQTRTCDYLGRLQDDRLLCILPHTDRTGGESGAKRILSAARGLSFQADGRPLSVTLSIGLSHFEGDNALFFDSLVEAAEEACAQATRGGGDRLVHRAPGPPAQA